MAGNALIKLRRDTNANWTSINPIPADGEPVYDKTRGLLFIGDGVTHKNNLRPVNRPDYSILNPLQDYGADNTAGAAVDTAFSSMFTDVCSNLNSNYSVDPRLTHSIFIPNGTYLFNGNGKLIGDIAHSTPGTGLTIAGAGADSTMLVFNPSAANGYLMYNNDFLYNITFRDLSFYITGTNAGSAQLFKSFSNGHAQNYRFERVNFGGTCLYGLALSGSNNNSEMVFDEIGMHFAMPGGAFLYSPAPGSGGSDQFVNYNFVNCNIEYASGDLVSMASGGSVSVRGGSLIHGGDGNQTTSTPQRFFRMLGTGHNAGANRLKMQDVRIEHRHNNSGIAYIEWDRGIIKLDNVDSETDSFLLSNPDAVVQMEFGAASNSYPRIEVSNCFLMGRHKFHYNANTYANSRPNITYRNCDFVNPVNQYTRAIDYFTFTADGGTTNAGGAPAIKLDNCHATFNLDQREVFDTVLNWHTANAIDVPIKRAYFHVAKGVIPNGTDGTQAFMNLPLYSLITRVRAKKCTSGGSYTGTDVSYALTDQTPTTIATAQTTTSATNSTLVPYNSVWEYDSGELHYFCDSDAKRKLTLTSSNISESARTDMFVLVEYT